MVITSRHVRDVQPLLFLFTERGTDFAFDATPTDLVRGAGSPTREMKQVMLASSISNDRRIECRSLGKVDISRYPEHIATCVQAEQAFICSQCGYTLPIFNNTPCKVTIRQIQRCVPSKHKTGQDRQYDQYTFHAHMFLLYCPPTSNIAAVNCPSEQYFVASMSISNMFSFLMAAS